MMSCNWLLNSKTALVGTIFGGLILSGVSVSWAGGPPPGTTRPPEAPEAAPQAAPQATPEATPEAAPQAETPIPRFPYPSARVALNEGKITLRLINASNTVVNYQVVGGTRERTLGENSEVTLENLSAPLTLTYQRGDGGLLLVRPQPTETTGVLEIRFTTTNDVDYDTKAMDIHVNGSVFLN